MTTMMRVDRAVTPAGTTTAVPMSVTKNRSASTRAVCTARCHLAPELREHHDRLLTVEHDAAELLELMELAVTWGELEYEGEAVIGPDQWVDFAAAHLWVEPERAERIFAVAVDIAACSRRRSGIRTRSIA